MGVTACTRFETACSPPIAACSPPPPPLLLGSESPISAQSPAHGVGADEPRFCGPPSLSQAEKLLLSPLRRRSRASSRLATELADSCVRIDSSDIQLGAKIGSGTWSVVYAGSWRGEECAVKFFRSAGRDATEQERRWQMFLKEAQILSELDSPRLVKLFGAFVGMDGCPRLVTELLSAGTLHEILHDPRASQRAALEPAHRFMLALHISQGIAYLHGLPVPIVHQDLKSKNVVVAAKSSDSGPPCTAKIIDFGLAEYVRLEDMTLDRSFKGDDMHGSAVYMAPECFAKPCSLSAKVDVWALGCVLAEVFGGAPPHTECEDLSQVIDKLLVQQLSPDIPEHADLAAGAAEDDSIRRLLQSCFSFALDERCSATDVLERLQDLAAQRGFELLDDNDVD